ncbi:ammonium transporter [Pseudosulfitobacter pseudonitzschiae]|uniref:ammonium transporter n=1 Tax=Pseudosulfitobacter pseudonitzschiae TaxID=1402135 RepID=UPI001AF0AFEA|nr:ammonium transporter [Pseudosulfitobacter pseudonitzschiae]MBM1817101.1 ammonium transporter [Pseudosulfitobacter pseudonitzschiae]MBM1834104.1 ammonium transporter [Pseudosulfitobacter pseudonitzschiae]MBM1838970.1 ammonium transporter [Pseudosulfitobacter pseudonitzschiae]MBM1843819.1 ammonium transporter [Pseudosulfitobacter pseudonitzschiae]MBM1848666.1 ammonium transporter [Pseudosulfitobacter pseudonitzschiae]
MNAADTAWIITATALVLFMTLPGLALFYGGLVRARNVLSVFMHVYAIACLMSVLWFVVGYSIAFGGGDSGIWGGLDKLLLLGVTADSLTGTLPEVLFFAFQMTFAIITPALIVGSYVERIGFGFVLLFSALWMLLCYAPVVHWIWGGGFLSDGGIFGETGVRDFAGGIVVHETAGIAALILAVFLGKRRNHTTPPHNPGLVMIGAAMLWVGWFGFNGGSQLAADGGAAMALTVTHISAATASLTWALWERLKFGKSSLVGIVTGTIAGLASITPASGFVGPVEALVIGAVAGILCQEAVNLIRNKVVIDDTLDVFAVHGVGGIFGTIMIAVFGAGTWVAQLGSLAIVGVYTTVVTIVLIVVVRAITPLRVDAETETNGLDLAVHGERAYDITS